VKIRSPIASSTALEPDAWLAGNATGLDVQERHELEESLRAILGALESRNLERQQRARQELLDYLLDGQSPISAEELQAAQREASHVGQP